MKWQPGLSGSHCGWKEDTEQANITRLGHQAENQRNDIQQGRNYVTVKMAGSRENMKRNKFLKRI